ncbi:MAG: PAS domain S-box protein [Acidobacteriota bacterium]|nr:PAS domain S-box protein [Acidobacteriota bacterium]
MSTLHILSFVLLATASVWFAVLVRRQKDWGLVFIALTAGFITLHEFLELLAVPGVGSPTRERFFSREIPARLLAIGIAYFLSRSLRERTQLEEQLRLGDLTYKGIFEAASDTILVLDRKSLMVRDVNRAGCEQYGYKREELLGKSIKEFSDEPEKTVESFQMGENKIPMRYHRRKNGSVFPVEIVASNFSQKNKEYLVGIVRDITDRVNVSQQTRLREGQLKRHNEALGRLSRSSILEQKGLQAALREITEVTAQALDVERVSVWLFDETRTKIVCQDLYQRGNAEHSDGVELSEVDYPSYFAALGEDRTITANDAHRDPRTKEFSENYLTPLGITSMLDAPIRLLGQHIGVVCNEQVGVARRWSPEEEIFAASIADFVTLAIETEERQKARKSVERLAEILQLTTDFVGISKVDGHSPFMNGGGRKMLGIDESENISDLQVRDFLPDSAWKIYREEALPLVMLDGVWAGETSLRRRDNSELDVSQVLIGHRNGSGKIEYLSTIMRDISDRKRGEQALRQSEERFRALYEDNPSMYFIVDANGIVLSVNRYGAEHLGYRVKELVGKSVLGVFHEDDKARVAEKFQACLQQPDKVAEWEFRKLHKNGTLMWVKEFVRVVKADDGKPVALIVCDDITEQKKTEQKIQQLNAELEIRVAERTAQLQAANHELEAFSYSVSHDLRAPLRAISGFSDALLADHSNRLDEQGLHYLKRINVASQRMGHLIDALLSLSRIMRKEIHLSDVNLSELAQQVIAELPTTNSGRKVEFVIQPGLKTNADTGLIRIVLENLISNAWKYTATRELAKIEFGSITLPGDGQQAFFVRDNGVGFDMAYSSQLFRVFQRLHSKKEFEGEGIGLTTVLRIIQRHGGKVWAEGAVNEGACFYFTIGA